MSLLNQLTRFKHRLTSAGHLNYIILKRFDGFLYVQAITKAEHTPNEKRHALHYYSTRG